MLGLNKKSPPGKGGRVEIYLDWATLEGSPNPRYANSRWNVSLFTHRFEIVFISALPGAFSA